MYTRACIDGCWLSLMCCRLETKIGDRGAECLGEGLKVNSSLQILYLVRLVIFICVCIVVLLLRERAGGESAAVSRVVHVHACV